MKLSASYNAFDGLEILPYSLKSIRNSVYFISVVWQEISNAGNPTNEPILDILLDLQQQGLIDKLIKFEPNLQSTLHVNETTKRNIGLTEGALQACTHHLNIDCDEIYTKAQFDFAKQYIISNDIEATACKMKTYYKFPNCIIAPAEEYYVPFIHKINRSRYDKKNIWKLTADPTRRIACKEVFAFSRLHLQMHHLSYVRNDIRKKLINSSAVVNYKHNIDNLVERYEIFKPNDIAYMAGAEIRKYSTCTTANIYDLIG